jgi:hypothetical protein
LFFRGNSNSLTDSIQRTHIFPTQTIDIERIANKARSFTEADEWEIQQHLSMTPQERMRAAKLLKERMFPGKNPDVREWHRSQKTQKTSSPQ